MEHVHGSRTVPFPLLIPLHMTLPQHMRADDPAAADPARRRLLQKSPFPRFPSFPSRTSTISTNTLPLPDDHPADDIHIDDARLPHPPDDKDVYRWAILYENQRGSVIPTPPLFLANHPLESPSSPHLSILLSPSSRPIHSRSQYPTTTTPVHTNQISPSTTTPSPTEPGAGSPAPG